MPRQLLAAYREGSTHAPLHREAEAVICALLLRNHNLHRKELWYQALHGAPAEDIFALTPVVRELTAKME